MGMGKHVIDASGLLTEEQFRRAEELVGRDRHRFKEWATNFLFVTDDEAAARALGGYLREQGVAYEHEVTTSWNPGDAEPASPLPAFRLDEDAARAWLTEQAARYNDGDGEFSESDDEFDLPSDWEAALHDQEVDDADKLLRAAQHKGLVAGGGIAYTQSDDGDQDSYSWEVTIGEDPAKLTLASSWENVRKLGDREARGVDAALAVLREAVDAANGEVARLGRFLAALA